MNDDTQPLAEDVGRLTAGELPRVVLAVAVLDVEGFHLSIELRHDPADGLLVSLTIHGWHGDPSLSEPMSVTPADLPDLAAAVAAAMRTVEDTEPSPGERPPLAAVGGFVVQASRVAGRAWAHIARPAATRDAKIISLPLVDLDLLLLNLARTAERLDWLSPERPEGTAVH